MQSSPLPTVDAGYLTDLRWFSRLTAAAALMLISVTWRLWFPQTRFPQIPLFAAAGRLPLEMEWGAGLAMIAALFTLFLCASTSRAGRTALLLFVASATVLVVIDQHRLQTWTWQFLLIAWILAMADDRQSVGLLQWLMVSIYVYSAISKLDVSFIGGEGQQILGGLLHSIGLSSTGWPEPTRRIVTAGMPVGELVVAVGLCLRKTRRTALVAAVAMHATLCLALGPWGLHHRPGVLIWNTCFVIQNLLLFARRSMIPATDVWSLPVMSLPAMRFLFHRRTDDVFEQNVRGAGNRSAGSVKTEPRDPVRWQQRSSRLAEVVVLAAILLPLLGPFGRFDQWPAWGLYASAPERLAVFIHCTKRGHLPEAIRRHIEEPPPLRSWCRLRIDRWSLDALRVPLYPQNRFRTGVALAIAERYHLGSAIRVIVESAANRWTGQRAVRSITGEADLRGFSDRFHLNAHPRTFRPFDLSDPSSMPRINENFLKLRAGYLFPEIARRVNTFCEAHPDADVIRLGIGDVTEPLSPAICSAMHRAVDEMSSRETFRGYGPEQGYPFLREAIAEHAFKSRGAEVTPDEIFVSDGSKCDTGNILDIFGADNVVAVTDPVYPVYVDTNVMAGRTGAADESGRYKGLIDIPVTAENDFVPQIPQRHVDLIYLCFPNNPTGTVATRETLTRWVEYATAEQAVILFDAAYEAFITDPDIPHSIYEIEGARDVAIEFRSFSKNAGFTGTRCAYTVVPKSLNGRTASGEAHPLRPLWNRRHCTKFNGVSYIVQRGAEASFSPEGQRQIAGLIDFYMTNARLLREGLEAVGITAYGGVHAPYVWLKTPGGESSWEFFDRLLETSHLVGTPGSGFGAAGEGYFRLSAFNSRENVEKAVRRLHRTIG